MNIHQPPRFRILSLLGLVLALAAWSPRDARAAVMYEVIDLGTLGGTSSYAQGINNKGQVVGYSSTSDGSTHAFLYDGTTMHDLGTLGGTNSYAQGINNKGQVVGYNELSGVSSHAFLYDPTTKTMNDLGTLPGGTDSQAYAINDKGQVVGYSSTSGSWDDRAFLYDPTTKTMQDLGTIRFDSYGFGLSGNGQVAGYSNQVAFLHDGTTMNDLGTLGGPYSFGRGINDKGQVVGYSDLSDGTKHAFLYDGTTMQDLGTLGGSISRAYGINASGQVVGESFTTPGYTRAFLYDGTTMHDLFDLVVSGPKGAFEARAINDNGWIAATGLVPGGIHALLLKPMSASAVPEPSSLIMLGLGALGLVGEGLRRRRRA